MRPYKNILALDLATRTGWAQGVSDSVIIETGSFRCAHEGASTSEIFGGFLGWLITRVNEHRPDVIVYEAPMAPSVMRGKTNVKTSRILLGLPAVCEAVCYRVAIETVLEANVGDVRQHFIGSRNTPGKEAKIAVQARCRQLGYSFDDDNAADACALWDYSANMLNARRGASSGPLFRGTL